MPRKKRISLKDIAASLGVSTSLVSSVLNGKAQQYRISEKMAKRVLAAAEKMDYSPNITAQSLRTGRSRLIGTIVTDISNPFYASISRIIEDRANELNYTVLFSSSDEDLDSTKRLIKVLINKGVDGLIIVPCDGARDAIKELHDKKFPVVLVDRHFPEFDIRYSCLNNYKATQLATQHLIDRGYQKISVISYRTEMSHIIDRIAGYKDVMVSKGLSNNINLKLINLSNPRREMRDALEYLLENDTEAIICLTNMLSVNGIYCLNEMKVNIPEDVAFVGFNRSDVFNLVQSRVSYIKQPIEEIANEAINMLVDEITGSHLAKGKVLVAEPELVIQESSPEKLGLVRQDRR